MTRMYPLLTLIALFFFAACQSEGPNVGVTLDDLEDDPATYYGQTVTVSGEVEEAFGPQVFRFEGTDLGSGVLVVIPSVAQVTGTRPGDPSYYPDDVVQVTGTVRKYVKAEIEREFGLTLSPELDVDLEAEGAIIVAESLSMTPGPGGATVTAQAEPVTDLAIVFDPAVAADLAGRPVQFTGVNVLDVVGDSTFWIGNDAGRLFVVLDEVPTPNTPVEGRYDINAGQTISLTGTLESLPAPDALRNDWKLDDATLKGLEGYTLYLRAQRASNVPESAPGPNQ